MVLPKLDSVEDWKVRTLELILHGSEFGVSISLARGVGMKDGTSALLDLLTIDLAIFVARMAVHVHVTGVTNFTVDFEHHVLRRIWT